jgi:ATP-dependent DNA helicase RecG
LRPELLNPLFAEVETLKGVGPQVAKQLAKLNLAKAVDLLFHLPAGSIERVRAPAASPVLLGRQVILDVTPRELRLSRGRARPGYMRKTARGTC